MLNYFGGRSCHAYHAKLLNVITISLMSIYRFFSFNYCLLHASSANFERNILNFTHAVQCYCIFLQMHYWRLFNQQWKRRWWCWKSLKLWKQKSFSADELCGVQRLCNILLVTSVQIDLTLKVHKGKNCFLIFTIIEET